MQNLLQAIAFLTRLPIARLMTANPDSSAGALPWYPWVGGLLASIVLAVGLALPADTPALVAAAILLTLFTWLTGALHLDGLADSIDALMGGHAAAERTLEIMKDPQLGAMGGVALILALLLKLALLSALWPHGLEALFAALMLARANVLVLFYTTPYVRVGGIAENFRESLTSPVLTLSLASTLVALLWLPLANLGLAIISCLLLLWWWRGYWLQRIGGFSGDIAGALIELSEIAVLLVFVLVAANAAPHAAAHV